MKIRRYRAAESLQQQDLARRRRDQVGSAHDVGNALQIVVDDDGELIREQTVGAPHDKIADVTPEVLRLRPLQTIAPVDSHLPDTKTPRAGSALHPILKEQHFLNPKEEEDDPYESTQITALVANGRGIFGVYSMREVFEYTRFWAAGTGREFALGAMHSQYDVLSTAEAIARAGIDAGAMFDKNSGLPLTLYTVPAES